MKKNDGIDRRAELLAVLVAAVIVMLLCSVVLNVWQGYMWVHRYDGMEQRVERDTVWRNHTVTLPAPVAERKTGEGIRVKIPALLCYTEARHRTQQREPDDMAVEAIPEDAGDSIEITLERTQLTYRDSLYTAYVSGYDARLDSLVITYPTVTEKRTVIKSARRWSVGVQAGYGYGIMNKKPDLYIGLGVGYRIF